MTESGLGDVTLAVSQGFYSSMDEQQHLSWGGKVKFATASTRIGTGKNDYAAQLIADQISGRFQSLISIGYQVLGSPAGQQLKNGYFGTLGGYFQASEQTGLGADFKASQVISLPGTEQRELRVYASQRLGIDATLQAYILKGFSDGSPAQGVGLMFYFVP